MTTPIILSSFFSEIDDINNKELYLNVVLLNLRYLGKDHPDLLYNEVYKKEIVSFSLIRDINTEAWGKKYGPECYFLQLDGTIYESPRKSEINEDLFDYWRHRYSTFSHPLLKCHFLELILCFDDNATDVQDSYVDSLMDLSRGEFEPRYITMDRLCTAFDMFKGTRKDLVVRIKQELERLSVFAHDNYIAEWAPYLNLMIQNMRGTSLFTKKEKDEIVSNAESKLLSMTKKDKDNIKDRLNPFAIQEVAEILADYYKQINDSESKKRVLSMVENSFRKIFCIGTSLQQLLWLQNIQQLYSRFGLIEEAQRLYPEIQAKGIEGKNELSQTSEEFTIPKEVIQHAIDYINQGDINSIYDRYVSYFTPKKTDIDKQIRQQANNPLRQLVGTFYLSESGMPLSSIGTPSADPQGNAYAYCAEFINHSYPIMRSVIEDLSSKEYYTKDIIVKRIMKSGLISSDRNDFIELGVDYYLEGKATIACHLLIPQIEHAICSLAVKINAQALRMQPSGNGYMVQLMDKLFDIKDIIEVLGENECFYLRTLLTEQRGLNIRNLMCHGLINPRYFDQIVADRVIHALFIIGGVKYQPESNK